MRGVSAVLLRIAKCDGLLICCRGMSGEITGSVLEDYVCGVVAPGIVCEGGIARGVVVVKGGVVSGLWGGTAGGR